MSREYHGNVKELKRTCEDLLVREGNKIFSKKAASMTSVGFFDYDLF